MKIRLMLIAAMTAAAQVITYSHQPVASFAGFAGKGAKQTGIALYSALACPADGGRQELMSGEISQYIMTVGGLQEVDPVLFAGTLNISQQKGFWAWLRRGIKSIGGPSEMGAAVSFITKAPNWVTGVTGGIGILARMIPAEPAQFSPPPMAWLPAPQDRINIAAGCRRFLLTVKFQGKKHDAPIVVNLGAARAVVPTAAILEVSAHYTRVDEVVLASARYDRVGEVPTFEVGGIRVW